VVTLSIRLRLPLRDFSNFSLRFRRAGNNLDGFGQYDFRDDCREFAVAGLGRSAYRELGKRGGSVPIPKPTGVFEHDFLALTEYECSGVNACAVGTHYYVG
jgi:hypothetical protein